MPIKQAPEQVLKDAIWDEAPKILAKWKPVIDKSDGSRIKTRYLDIRFTCERNYIKMEFLSPTDIVRNRPMYPENIREAIAPELPDSIFAPHDLNVYNNKAIIKEAVGKLKFIAEYCFPLLDGDEKAWIAIDNWMIDRGGRIKRLDVTKEEFLASLKNKADEAWAKENYWAVCDFYTWYQINGGRMTLKDRWHEYLSSRATFLTR